MKDENERLKLEKCQLEKEKNDVQEERDGLVIQKNNLQTDLRAKEAQVHILERSAQLMEGWSEVKLLIPLTTIFCSINYIIIWSTWCHKQMVLLIW